MTRRILVSCSLALILAAKLLDILPNSGLIAPVWLIAGAILGRMELLESGEVQAGAEEEANARASPRYARQFTPPAARAAAPDTRRRTLGHSRITQAPGYRK